ncbi:MAG: hypothetical protein K2M16_05550 [Muribaculaceae bacterium]|nr:hypothetical protein [Muribaculaceae bacterium]
MLPFHGLPHIDGSHTPVCRMSDCNGLPLSMSEPQAGNSKIGRGMFFLMQLTVL